MLAHARGFRQDIMKGRWVVVTYHHKHMWEVIVEPDYDSKQLVVITGYPLWEN